MAKIKVQIDKDATGFPSIVTITDRGKKLKVTSIPMEGFTIDGPRSIMPSAFETFRVIMPRVSYQKEVGLIQAEDNTQVTSGGAAADTYVLVKTLGTILTETHDIYKVIVTFWALANTATVKVTYEEEGAAEMTWLEQSTTDTDPVTYIGILSDKIDTDTVFRVYVKNSAIGVDETLTEQLTFFGDKISAVGHLF